MKQIQIVTKKARKLVNLKNEILLKLLVLIDRKLQSIHDIMSANGLVCQITRTMMQCANSFAPEKFSGSQNQNHWMNIEMKMHSKNERDHIGT